MVSYVDELTGWVKKNRQASRPDKNLVMFLAIKKELAEAIRAGYSVRTIWRHMCETKRLEVSYDSFLSYVNRHIRSELEASAPSKGKAIKPSAASEIPGFKFNPVGKKEDLL